MKYVLFKYISAGLVPKEKKIFKSKKLSRVEFIAKLYLKWFANKNIPLAIAEEDKPLDPIKWLIPWAVDDERNSLGFVDYQEGRKDLIALKENVISGRAPIVDEIPEEQIQSEVESNARKLILPHEMKDITDPEVQKALLHIKKKAEKKSKGGIILP